MLGYDIDLYEDNAGNLYLLPMQGNWVYQIDPDLSPNDTFDEDCSALYKNEYAVRAYWYSEWVHRYADIYPLLIHPETHIIATWYNDGPYTLHQNPGDAGRKYLRLPKD